MTTTYNKDNRWTTTRKENEALDKRIRTGLRIPFDLNTWLILEAQKQGISKNALILKILWEWADKQTA